MRPKGIPPFGIPPCGRPAKGCLYLAFPVSMDGIWAVNEHLGSFIPAAASHGNNMQWKPKQKWRYCMIRALFLDLDGTLLNSKKEISPLTKTTLENCKKDGVKLFVATARPPLLERMLFWDKDTISLFEGGSYYNGGCISINRVKEYIFVSNKLVKKIIDLVFQNNKLNIALQLENELHAFRFPLKENNYNSWGLTSKEIMTLEDAGNQNTIKLLIFYENLVDSNTLLHQDLIRSIKTVCGDEAQIYLTDNCKTIQIMGNAVNKLRGIERIRQLYGYAETEIAVFGDDVNDIEMLSAYKYSFAMGNAQGSVKSVAKYSTLDNDNDGIHHAIKNFLML